MLSKARIKWIKSLEMRKYRLQNKAFVAEGPKLVGELLPHSTPLYIAATKDWLESNSQFIIHNSQLSCPVDEVNQQELTRASLLRTPQSVLAVSPFHIRHHPSSLIHHPSSSPSTASKTPATLAPSYESPIGSAFMGSFATRGQPTSIAPNAYNPAWEPWQGWRSATATCPR